ncbi:MAG: quinol monooxygenase YgiN [Natronomonas sp.]|jgi:quinol monooxygenase YgiN
MLVIHASMPLDPEHRDEALDRIADLARTVREEEDGVLDYRATTDVNDPNVVRFVERYEDEQALATHSQTDHYQAFAEALPGWLAGEPEVLRFDVDGMSELDL